MGGFFVGMGFGSDQVRLSWNGLNPDAGAFRAGRIMLEQMDQLVANRESFAFETTLATRTYAGWLANLRITGYEVYLYYYSLHSPELAIARIAERVQSGGHFVPDETVRMRYSRSIRNFFELYRPQADCWEVYGNSFNQQRLIALGAIKEELIAEAELWEVFMRSTDYV